MHRFLMIGDNHPDGRPGPHLRPWEIQKLTLAEVVWMLEEPGTKQGMTDQEIMDYAQWYRGLTIEEKLELARADQLL